jgi:hypothetical protein
MRAYISLLALVAATACGQDIDHPTAAAACDPKSMKCSNGPLETGGGDGSQAGADSGGDAVVTLAGRVIGFTDDFFDQGSNFAGVADVSADGRNGSRVKATYDRTSFEMVDLLKTSANWFLTEPAANSGFLPTLVPVDTRRINADELVVAVAPALQIEGILQSLGSAPSSSRAQIVMHVIDDQGRSVPGVTAELTAELVAYRTAGAWLGGDVGTDDSGLLLIGNASVGSALASASIALRGKTAARVDVQILAGATTVVTAVVTPK